MASFSVYQSSCWDDVQSKRLSCAGVKSTTIRTCFDCRSSSSILCVARPRHGDVGNGGRAVIFRKGNGFKVTFKVIMGINFRTNFSSCPFPPFPGHIYPNCINITLTFTRIYFPPPTLHLELTSSRGPSQGASACWVGLLTLQAIRGVEVGAFQKSTGDL